MKTTSQSHSVTVEHNGKTHSADYTVESGVVIVHYGMATNQALATHPALHLHEARRLFVELLEADRWRP